MTKTILITGSNRGIGLELVKQYATSGWTVLACCREPNKANELQRLKETNNSISIYQLDVGNENDIKQLAQKLKNTTIDILFNNAGVAGEDVPLDEVTSADLLSTFKVNTLGPVLLIQALHEQVAKSKNKIVANTSSFLGSIESNQEGGMIWLSYRISKSALNAATRSLANQLKSQDVTVVAIDPGWVQTDMGGKDATITTEECVHGIRKVLENISIKDSGNFIKYTGDSMPW